MEPCDIHGIEHRDVSIVSQEFSEKRASHLLTMASYGEPFVLHTYLHHLTRIDHRHNFSPYSTVLYLNSSPAASPSKLKFESLAFIPQLFLSVVGIPLAMAKRDLASCMLAQTFAFVTFNKVCTSQVSPTSFITISRPLIFLVFPLVYDLLAILSPGFVPSSKSSARRLSSWTLDCWSSCVVI